MVHGVKVLLRDVQKVKKDLIKKGVINHDYVIRREGDFLFLPVKRKVKGVVDVHLEKREKRNNIEEMLQQIFTKKELALFPRAHEVVGDILILEVPLAFVKKEKKIAEAYLGFYKNIKAVVKKSATHSGVYRTRGLKVLAGVDNKETIYKESGLRFKVHLEKMYFSSRLGHERLRIAQQVKKREEVLVMFSGCAPYCCVIAKHSNAQCVTGIEINPEAHKYAIGNVQMSKLWHKIKLYEGDVRKVLPRLKKKFDRIVMPLPKTGEEFLPLALKYIRKGGVVHYYAFLQEKEFKDYEKKIKEICQECKKKCRILRVVKAGQHAPYVFRVCFDIRMV